MTPNEQELKALISLRHNKDFMLVMDMFTREWCDAAKESTKNWGEVAIKMAGTALAFEKFIEVYNEAEDRLKNIKNQVDIPEGVVI